MGFGSLTRQHVAHEEIVFNLILALVWLVLALVLFAWPWLGLPAFRFTGACWLFLVLCTYNLVRWWAGRWSRLNRSSINQQDRPRRYHPEGPPDPNFDFSDQLFPKKSEAITRPENRKHPPTNPEEKKPGQADPPPADLHGK